MKNKQTNKQRIDEDNPREAYEQKATMPQRHKKYRKLIKTKNKSKCLLNSPGGSGETIIV